MPSTNSMDRISFDLRGTEGATASISILLYNTISHVEVNG
jgi:hypothetical protein